VSLSLKPLKLRELSLCATKNGKGDTPDEHAEAEPNSSKEPANLNPSMHGLVVVDYCRISAVNGCTRSCRSAGLGVLASSSDRRQLGTICRARKLVPLREEHRVAEDQRGLDTHAWISARRSSLRIQRGFALSRAQPRRRGRARRPLSRDLEGLRDAAA
jgi:hypothetical protein